jgi:iron complex transport system substrate-binding protein
MLALTCVSRLFVFVVTVLFCGAAIAEPVRIMSLRICTDGLLLDLVPPQRIASVEFLAREKEALAFWPQAARIPINYGTAEEILDVHPDLILTDPFMSASIRALLGRAGIKVIEVPPAENFDQIRAVTRQVAKAVGAQARGEQLIAQMDKDLRQVALHRPARPIRVAEWGNGGYVPGANGLFGAMLKSLGAQSISQSDGYYDVEALLAAKPEVLVYSDSYAGMPSLRDDQDSHPALTARFPRVSYSPIYGCGLPQTATVTRQLQTALAGAVRR